MCWYCTSHCYFLWKSAGVRRQVIMLLSTRDLGICVMWLVLWELSLGTEIGTLRWRSVGIALPGMKINFYIMICPPVLFYISFSLIIWQREMLSLLFLSCFPFLLAPCCSLDGGLDCSSNRSLPGYATCKFPTDLRFISSTIHVELFKYSPLFAIALCMDHIDDGQFLISVFLPLFMWPIHIDIYKVSGLLTLTKKGWVVCYII